MRRMEFRHKLKNIPSDFTTVKGPLRARKYYVVYVFSTYEIDLRNITM